MVSRWTGESSVEDDKINDKSTNSTLGELRTIKKKKKNVVLLPGCILQ